MSNPNKININREKCARDGICIEVCPCNIFRADETGLAEVNPEFAPTCVACGHCVAVCPTNAIALNDIDGTMLEKAPEKLENFDSFSSLVKSRRSIRSFKPDQLPIEELKKLLELTRWAPTAKNSQALSWVLVNGHERVQKLSEAVIEAFRTEDRMEPLVSAFELGHDIIHRRAPHLLVAYAHEKYKWGTYDASIALNTIELGARCMGIGTCWGGFTTWASTISPIVAQALELPAEHKVYAVLMLGKPNFKYNKIPQRNALKLKVLT
ncbi:MAG: nitroreductase family protein [Candidatus Rifleibacteriota bacterium]